MNRAIQLGANALGKAAPNPMVGAVIMYKDRILGEGFTSPPGGPHAEVNAIPLSRKRTASKATLYVTLGALCHFGKTPPCTDLILNTRSRGGGGDHRSARAGKWQRHSSAKDAGCRVEVGILEDACREHHRRISVPGKETAICHFKMGAEPGWLPGTGGAGKQETGRPFWISNQRSSQLVHQWRTRRTGYPGGQHHRCPGQSAIKCPLLEGEIPFEACTGSRTPGIRQIIAIFDNSAETIVLTSTKDRTPSHERTYELLDLGGR